MFIITGIGSMEGQTLNGSWNEFRGKFWEMYKVGFARMAKLTPNKSNPAEKCAYLKQEFVELTNIISSYTHLLFFKSNGS